MESPQTRMPRAMGLPPITPQLSLGGSNSSQDTAEINLGTSHKHYGANVQRITINHTQNYYFSCQCGSHSRQTQPGCTQVTSEEDETTDALSEEARDDISEYFTAPESGSVASLSSESFSSFHNAEMHHDGNAVAEVTVNVNLSRDEIPELGSVTSLRLVHDADARNNERIFLEINTNWDDDAAPTTSNAAGNIPTLHDPFRVNLFVGPDVGARFQTIKQCIAVMQSLEELAIMHPFVKPSVTEFTSVLILGLCFCGSDAKVVALCEKMCTTMSVLLRLHEVRNNSTLKILGTNMRHFLEELTDVIKRCGSFCKQNMKRGIGGLLKWPALSSNLFELRRDLCQSRQKLEHVINTCTTPPDDTINQRFSLIQAIH